MEASQQTLKTLSQLLLEDEALRRKAQTLGDPELVVDCLVRGAAARGLPLEAGEVRAALAQVQPMQPGGALSDDMLDRVAGGMNIHEWNAMSVFSLGVACFVMSANKAKEEAAMGGDDHIDFSFGFCAN